ncbi:hypothetical protein U27_03056 [Candidatus Vecturithrix granuli]|uniref:HTH deoR-type domain-containing protein n=1 Tax=Vecturithrix granuli TaxID=1499967 RepID=A0A081BUT9_VECG1|nr:hypothetical protein U27_03056 [Candidatus Vecturithrix granuli]
MFREFRFSFPKQLSHRHFRKTLNIEGIKTQAQRKMSKTEIRTVKLLEMLQTNERVDVKTVTAALDISEATARRLFAKLEQEGEVIRTLGGVKLAPQLGHDYSFRVSISHRSREKTQIGTAAAELVNSNERIFLDSGTTVLKLAEALAVKIHTGAIENLVVVTNSVTLIEILAKSCKVILIGGEIRAERRDVCGTIAEKTLLMFHVDKAFLGADAISLTSGLMTTDERTSKMSEIIIERADKTYILADSEKFHKTSFVTYAPVCAATTILTDDGVTPETVAAFTDLGAQIEIVHSC